MGRIDVAQLRTSITAIGQQVVAPDQIAVTITAALLVVVFALAVAAIWRGRRRVAAPVATPSNPSGFTRWLTPAGAASSTVSADAAAAAPARPRRKSGANRTIRVSTPVSKVPVRALTRAGADALDIARKTGLSRDAVAMMLANANPQAVAKKVASAKAAAATQPSPRGASAEREMAAPGAYGSAPRAQAPAAKGRTLGTRFNARVS